MGTRGLTRACSVLACFAWVVSAFSRPRNSLWQSDLHYCGQGRMELSGAVRTWVIALLLGAAVVTSAAGQQPTLPPNDTLSRADSATAEQVVLIEGRREPAVALVLSVMAPGAGQIYNGQWAKFSVIFGGQLLTAALMSGVGDCTLGRVGLTGFSCGRTTAAVVIGLGTWLYSMIDAPIAAGKINRRLARRVSVSLGPRSYDALSASAGSRQAITPTLVPSTLHRRAALSLVRFSF